MKCIALIVLVCAAAIDAQVGMGGLNRYFPGLFGNSGYTSGNGYSGQQYGSGTSGGAQQGGYATGGGASHDIGSHHSSLNSVTQAVNDENHSIGTSGGYAQGHQGGSGFNNYLHGLGTQGGMYNQGYNQGLGGLGYY